MSVHLPCKEFIEKCQSENFSGVPVVKNYFPMQRAGVQFLVMELRSYMPCGKVKKEKKNARVSACRLHNRITIGKSY